MSLLLLVDIRSCRILGCVHILILLLPICHIVASLVGIAVALLGSLGLDLIPVPSVYPIAVLLFLANTDR